MVYLSPSSSVPPPGFLFCSGFALVTLLGCILKEPLYAHSLLYVATFLLGTLQARPVLRRFGETSTAPTVSRV
jgi:hypothetical protein